MRKVSVVILVLLLVSQVTYGQSCGNSGNDRVIQGKDITYAPGGKITLKGGASAVGGSIILKPGDGMNGDGNVIIDLGSSSSLVGIGTTSPADKLDVNGTVRMTGFKLTTGATNGYVLTSNSSGVGTWQLQWLKNGSDIYYSGDVGIGTTSPSKKLEVNGDIRIPVNYRMYFGGASILGYHSGFDGLRFYGNGGGDTNLAITVNPSGDVGIGTPTPQAKLHIEGEGPLQIGENTGIYTLLNNNTLKFHRDGNPSYICQMGNGSLKFTTNGGADSTRITIDNAGKVGIGTPSPQAKLNVYGGDIQVGINSGNYTLLGYNDLKFNRDSGDSYISKFGIGRLIFTTNGGSDCVRMVINSDGNVGIGTRNPKSELAVNGKITAKELELTSTGWSDFVFTDNYELMPLDKLEKHIKVNRSLPGIPKENEVVENGVNIGEMQAKLLEKVEELTLYVIELKKENEELKKRIDALEN
jgi:hypothetical protein